jgi:hypothetical protein
MKWGRRVILVLIVLLLAVISLALSTSMTDKYYNTHKAIAQSRFLVGMCEAYRNYSANPQRGKYPATLTELVKPPFDGGQFVVEGERDLIDPWGNPYRYAVIPNAKGEQEVYVWCERTVNGKLTLHGAKRRADGEIELFGRPEE